jgi:hypothetical protein
LWLSYGLVCWGFETWKQREIFFFSPVFTPAMGPTQSPIQLVPLLFCEENAAEE